MVEEGDKAPAFALQADDGRTVRLSDLKGRWVVLYFYPADATPGCTLQAEGFRAHHGEFRGLGAEVVGVSPDPVERHCAWRAEMRLPYTLLADADHAVAEAYGAWGKKVLYGRESVGIVRSTFLVDPQGRIAKVRRRVKVDGHAERTLEDLRALQHAAGRATSEDGKTQAEGRAVRKRAR